MNFRRRDTDKSFGARNYYSTYGYLSSKFQIGNVQVRKEAGLEQVCDRAITDIRFTNLALQTIELACSRLSAHELARFFTYLSIQVNWHLRFGVPHSDVKPIGATAANGYHSHTQFGIIFLRGIARMYGIALPEVPKSVCRSGEHACCSALD